MRDVLIVVYDGIQLLDAAGPLEVLHGAGYQVRLASPDGKDVIAHSGARLGVDCALDVPPPDTLLIAGGWTYGTADPGLVEGIARLAAGARRVTSVCTGAFLLAAAGLLDGRRATTHWAFTSELAASHPSVTVVPDAIFVRDDPIVTAAGVTAGVDLALALVEEDEGAGMAREIAKWLVVFLQRPGGQSQFSVHNRTPPVRDTALRRLLEHISAAPGADLSVAAMAGRLSMSPRHFSRMFTRQVGCSPGRYVERARVEAARLLLENGDEGVEVVARLSGFGTTETMRRTFLRELGVPPSAYRSRFRTTARQI
ncbi:GlxA family transcriptional regulator [Spirillospora sp. NPDC048911]|uniref:GlxA family transcriptional regulator n=1 Tax=Spirillospora sp. NPDC048911 TaxID=3364527 RepID=UPI0037241206